AVVSDRVNWNLFIRKWDNFFILAAFILIHLHIVSRLINAPSLHDALPILGDGPVRLQRRRLDRNTLAARPATRPLRHDVGFLGAEDGWTGRRRTAVDGGLEGGFEFVLVGGVGHLQRFGLGRGRAGAGRVEGRTVHRYLVEDITPIA